MKLFLNSLSFLFVCLIIASCGLRNSMTPLSPTSSMTSEDGSSMPSAFAQFPDIPFPEKTKMDLEKTVLLGSGETWTGKLYLKTPFSSNQMFDFYVSQMPNFGWEQLAVIRSKISSLSFLRENRVATLQIENSGSSSSFVSIVVMPKSAAGSGVSSINTPVSKSPSFFDSFGSSNNSEAKFDSSDF